MSAFKGIDVGLTWNGASIPGCREKDVTLNGDPVDISSDDDAGWRALLLNKSGVDQVDLKISGVTKDKTLKNDWFAGTRTRSTVVTYPDGSTLTGMFYLANYADKGPYNDATTFEATLSSSGPVVWAPGA